MLEPSHQRVHDRDHLRTARDLKSPAGHEIGLHVDHEQGIPLGGRERGVQHVRRCCTHLRRDAGLDEAQNRGPGRHGAGRCEGKGTINPVDESLLLEVDTLFCREIAPIARVCQATPRGKILTMMRQRKSSRYVSRSLRDA